MRLKRTDVAALAPGILGTIAWHWTLLSSSLDKLPGDRGDARSALYLVEHWYQVFRGRADALSPAMFYPVEQTIGYSEAMFFHALPYSVFRLAGMDMFSSIAVPLILFNFLNYVACFFLLRRVFRLNAVASIVGALFFAFNSPRFNHVGHMAYQVGFLLVIVVACVVRFVQKRATISQPRAFVLLGAAALTLAFQFFILPYQGWFFVFWLCLLVVLILAIPSTRQAALSHGRRFFRPLAGAAVVFAAGMIPFFLVYMPVAAFAGPRGYDDVNPLTPDGWSLVRMSDLNYIWGDFSRAITRAHPLFSTELNIGIGLVPSIAFAGLIGWAIWSLLINARNQRRNVHRDLLAAAVLATALLYALAMRYWNGFSPWLLIYLYVPGADGLRAIARHALVLTLPLSIAFAVLVHRAVGKISERRDVRVRYSFATALVAVCLFGIVEQFGRSPYFSARAERARLVTLASALPQNCAVFYTAAAPVRAPVKGEYQIDAMLVSSMRGIPTINGYGGHKPPGWLLQDVETPQYERRVASWIAKHRVAGPVCRLEITD